MPLSSAHSPRALEVLACPHCDRLFHVTPAVLGKKIRCRDCRQIFHVPLDTTSVPLGPAVGAVDDTGDEPLPPIAIASVKDGRDVRACPTCGRTFAMKPAFAGKTIRCRGCRDSFRVLATEPAPAEQAPLQTAPLEAQGSPSAPESLAPPPPPPPPAVPSVPPVPAAIAPPPMIFEDIGDVLEDLLPGENVISVVRPRNLPRRRQSADMASALVIAVTLLGLCAVLAPHVIEGSRDKRPAADNGNEIVVVSPPKSGGGRRPTAPPSPLDDIGNKKRPRVPDKPKPTPLPPEATAALEQSFRQAYASLQQEDFAAADRALTDAAKRVGSNHEAGERVQRWRLFTEYARRFVGHRSQAFENANKGRDYEVDGDVIAVNEISAERVVYLRRGQMTRVPRSALDPRVEMAIVSTWLAKGGFPENHIYLGARWLCLDPPDRERAQREWQTAKARGATVEKLLPILDEPFIR